MRATVYGFAFSHPVQCARAMLRHKGIEHRLVTVPPGPHPLVVRALGFPGTTVPAVVLEGRRLQGTLNISRALEELVPDPPLFPAALRAEVEAAERWAEATLQNVPRRAFRWALAHRGQARRGGLEQMGVPLAPAIATALAPGAKAFARLTGVTSEVLARDVRSLPGWLDHADALVAAGVIGGEQPNAADFQIGSSVATLRAFEDFAPLVAGRPVAAVSERHFRVLRVRLEPLLPPDWLRAD